MYMYNVHCSLVQGGRCETTASLLLLKWTVSIKWRVSMNFDLCVMATSVLGLCVMLVPVSDTFKGFIVHV